MNGVKRPESTWINEYELIQKALEIQEVIPAAAAKTYLEQRKRGLVPEWVEAQVDIKNMKLAALADG